MDDAITAQPKAVAPTKARPDASTDQPTRFRISRHIVCLAEPDHPRAEAIRALRAHLLAGHLAHGRRSLAVCAATPGVGSTYLSVNLAVAFAQAGINTLLVDANLHDGAGVESLIQPEEDVPGLRQVLQQNDPSMMNAIQNDVLPNLSVLYSGGSGPNAQELLASKQFKLLIDDCMRDHEITIVDTPAGKGSSDVRRIAKSVRYALVVARRNQTMLSDLRTLVDELDSDRVNLIGSFLTDF
ncbi:CpsD/CapB family tyrosine-protein kinase [Sphingomonas sp. FW199]|uniref:CpsD/CapB family tyrosine-protein kinase n=1 Tax=Sphingomonas sp. FW199 TaxID=3400217 RepID=UPI003CE6CA82